MSITDHLLKLARTYATAERLDLSTVSWRALGDTKKLAAIEGGADIQVRRCEGAIEWFARNWTAKADWPGEVPRPCAEHVMIAGAAS